MIRVGTCGFSFKDWKGSVYPDKIRDSEILNFYSNNFGMDTVEIDASYYTFFSRQTVQSWIAKTPSHFLFTVKCHKDMTGNESRKGETSMRAGEDIFNRFIDSFSPLIDNGRLACFLAQFGPIFWKNKENLDTLQRFRSMMGTYPLAIEFRHRSWFGPETIDHTFSWLEEHQLYYVAVDLPEQRTLPPFIPHACGNTAYLRLHGRNSNWFNSTREERYNYQYSDSELEEFIPHIRLLDREVPLSLIYFNNCHAGAAMRNALRLKKLLGLDETKNQQRYVQGELNLSM
ncbi:MAG: DUF72 domain-containing protein [Vulcanimicrobiota bacterium]